MSYTSWRQAAGYFDGDGNVGIEVVKRVLRIKIRFVDTWKPQVDSIRTFLERHKVHVGNIGRDEKKTWQPAYRLDIGEVKSVIRTAKAILAFTVKKRDDLRIAIEYLESRMTGNQAIEAFNAEVRSGRRRGKIRTCNLPLTRIEGIKRSQIESAKNARAAYAVEISREIERKILRDHAEQKLGHIRLSRKYGYSVSVIRRVLGAP